MRVGVRREQKVSLVSVTQGFTHTVLLVLLNVETCFRGCKEILINSVQSEISKEEQLVWIFPIVPKFNIS